MGEEERELEREEVFECCAEIFDHFEPADLDRHKEREFTLFGLIEWMTSPDVDFLESIFEKSDLRLEDREAGDVFHEFWGEVVVLSFAMGFGMGSWRDCPDPNVRDRIKQIQRTIEERGLFRCNPRVRA